MAAQQSTLFTTPPVGCLPASDPDSLFAAACIYLAGRESDVQLVAGNYEINNGDLPAMIVNDNLCSYDVFERTGLFEDLDKKLNEKQALDSYFYTRGTITNSLTDLVNHSLYVLPQNYRQVTYPAQTKALSYLQSFYVPARIRSLYLIRLRRIQEVGWGEGLHVAGPLPGLNCDDEEADRQLDAETTVTAAGGLEVRSILPGWTERVEALKRKRIEDHDALVKAIRFQLATVSNLLGSNDYFFNSTPTTIDLRLYSVLSLVLSVDLPDQFLVDIIKSCAPNLVAHHRRMSERLPWANMKPTYARDVKAPSPVPATRKAKSEKDKRFENGRWWWFAGVAVTFVGYVFASGIVAIDFGGEDDDEEYVVQSRGILPVHDEDEDEDEDEEELVGDGDDYDDDE